MNWTRRKCINRCTRKCSTCTRANTKHLVLRSLGHCGTYTWRAKWTTMGHSVHTWIAWNNRMLCTVIYGIWCWSSPTRWRTSTRTTRRMMGGQYSLTGSCSTTKSTKNEWYCRCMNYKLYLFTCRSGCNSYSTLLLKLLSSGSLPWSTLNTNWLKAKPKPYFSKHAEEIPNGWLPYKSRKSS